MSLERKPTVVFIGAGNLATNLALSLFRHEFPIIQVVSRNMTSAKLLAEKVHASHASSLSSINVDADLYIVAVSDSAIPEVISALPKVNGHVVHTSGSTDVSVLSISKAIGYGVLYPFQTFSKSRSISFDEIPFCIEASNEVTLKLLQSIAECLSRRVILMDSQTRMWLHLTGVFANNFTNHLLAISSRIAEDKGFSYDLLKPLVEETVDKAFADNPINAQTGPAIRFDQSTINNHIAKLEEYSPELAMIYKELSLSIQKLAKK